MCSKYVLCMQYLFQKFHSNLFLLCQGAQYTTNLFGALLSPRVSLPSRCTKRLVNTCMSKNCFQTSFRKLMHFRNFRLSYSERKNRSEKTCGSPEEIPKQGSVSTDSHSSGTLQCEESSSYSLCPVLRAVSSEFSGYQHCNQLSKYWDLSVVTLYVITRVFTGLYSCAIKACGVYKCDCLLHFPPAEPKSQTFSKFHVEGGGAFSMQI